jgi:hypothetical protein
MLIILVLVLRHRTVRHLGSTQASNGQLVPVLFAQRSVQLQENLTIRAQVVYE